MLTKNRSRRSCNSGLTFATDGMLDLVIMALIWSNAALFAVTRTALPHTRKWPPALRTRGAAAPATTPCSATGSDSFAAC